MKLCIPTLVRYDLLNKLLLSAEAGTVRPSSYVVVDNGGSLTRDKMRHGIWKEFHGDVLLVTPSSNLGVAASWNLALDICGKEGAVISNDDVVFGPDTFRNIVEAMDNGGKFVGNGWFLFGQSWRCTEEVGYYDENFYPAYCEDSDYEVRLYRAGIRRVPIPVDYAHETFASSTKEESDRWRAEGRKYFEQKWGGLYLGEVPMERFGVEQMHPFELHPPPGWRLRGVR